MKVTGNQTLPDNLVEKSIKSYQFSQSANFKEKLMINRWEYANEHGDFILESEISNDTVDCSLSFVDEEEKYTREIPLWHQSITSEIYPVGDIIFDDVTLMAISFNTGFPWTREVATAWYWAEISEDSLEGIDKQFENYRVLKQYFPFQGINDTPPDCVVQSEKNNSDEFMVVDVRNATHCKTPNPWVYAACAVLYEDSETATEFLTHPNVYGNPEKYHLVLE